jgi:hypothetical protein
MRNSYNASDGFYMLLLLISFAGSLYLGDLLRIKIQGSNWNHKLSIFAGAFVEILTMIAGVMTGFFLVKIFAANT